VKAATAGSVPEHRGVLASEANEGSSELALTEVERAGAFYGYPSEFSS